MLENKAGSFPGCTEGMHLCDTLHRQNLTDYAFKTPNICGIQPAIYGQMLIWKSREIILRLIKTYCWCSQVVS